MSTREANTRVYTGSSEVPYVQFAILVLLTSVVVGVTSRVKEGELPGLWCVF
jgi:hypothetical protein